MQLNSATFEHQASSMRYMDRHSATLLDWYLGRSHYLASSLGGGRKGAFIQAQGVGVAEGGLRVCPLGMMHLEEGGAYARSTAYIMCYR